MLKKYRFGLIILVVFSAIVFVTYEQEHTRRYYQRECQKAVHPVEIPFLTNDAGQTDDCKDAKDYMPWWYVLVAWPEGIGAWVLIATGVAIGWQSHETRKAAKAAQVAAAASLRQVDHMVNAERPFMMIEVREGGPRTYHFYAVNYGKSPAQLVFVNDSPIGSVTKFDEVLEDKPWYGFGFYEEGMTVFNQQWIPPGKDRSIGTIDAEVIKIWVEGNPGLNEGMEELLFRGAIKYRGRFSEDIWHSKYCYRVFTNSIRMAGPHGWNDYS